MDKIAKQVEFYFSDVNIAKDTFLKGKMAESAEGFVPVAVLLTFKRLAALVESAQDKEKTVLDAVRNSPTLVIDEATRAIRRRDPLPDSLSVDECTVYAKPVNPKATLDELESFFTANCGPVRAVWRRPLPGAAKASTASAAAEVSYKDSVFVVFDSRETAQRVCEAPPLSPDTKAPMTLMSKTAYLASKNAHPVSKEHAFTPKAAPSLRTPPMPKNASIQISGVGSVDGIKAVKGLWSVEQQPGIRYVTLGDDKADIRVIFQDTATCERMIKDLTEKGTTLNGVIPVVRRLDTEADALATSAAEKEIMDRATTKAQSENSNRGRGRGRGVGRGRGRGKRLRE